MEAVTLYIGILEIIIPYMWGLEKELQIMDIIRKQFKLGCCHLELDSRMPLI